jgi:hypothetical protein
MVVSVNRQGILAKVLILGHLNMHQEEEQSFHARTEYN